jgi:hypothetical protein
MRKALAACNRLYTTSCLLSVLLDTKFRNERRLHTNSSAALFRTFREATLSVLPVVGSKSVSVLFPLVASFGVNERPKPLTCSAWAFLASFCRIPFHKRFNGSHCGDPAWRFWLIIETISEKFS